MIEINLLPKEMRKARGLRVPRSVLIGAAAGAALVLLLFLATTYQGYRLHHIDGQIAQARQQADKMRGDIELVDRLVDVKTKVLARLAAIEQLDRDREKWVRILEDFSVRVPEFLWVTIFKPAPVVATAATKPGAVRQPGSSPPADTTAPSEQRLVIEGFSFTLNGLANFLIELNASDYFGDIGLDYAKIVQIEKQRVYTFSLRCSLEEPVAVEEAPDVEGSAEQGSTETDTESSVAVSLEE